MDNSTLTIMEQRVAGLRATLDGLREDERLFQRAAGLKVQQEKDHTATLELEARLTAGKKELAELLDQKARAMQTTATALAQKMGQMLPYGQAVFSVDDEGKVFLGWDLPNHGLVAHGGLSGGQRTMFDGALAYALARQDRKNTRHSARRSGAWPGNLHLLGRHRGSQRRDADYCLHLPRPRRPCRRVDGGLCRGGGPMSTNLPALPGGVGPLSDRLAKLSGRIALTGDLIADYRSTLARAPKIGIPLSRQVRREARHAMRPIEKAHVLARLQLQIIMSEHGWD